MTNIFEKSRLRRARFFFASPSLGNRVDLKLVLGSKYSDPASTTFSIWNFDLLFIIIVCVVFASPSVHICAGFKCIVSEFYFRVKIVQSAYVFCSLRSIRVIPNRYVSAN